ELGSSTFDGDSIVAPTSFKSSIAKSFATTVSNEVHLSLAPKEIIHCYCCLSAFLALICVRSILMNYTGIILLNIFASDRSFKGDLLPNS
uniref:Histone H5 n=1 Tax=Parascaris univalens TaxID=6257 RepID=A0A914ZZH2_PARUN